MAGRECYHCKQVRAPQIRRVEPSSKTKFVHFIRVTHRDEVEPPITDWLREAYQLQDVLASGAAPPVKARR